MDLQWWTRILIIDLVQVIIYDHLDLGKEL